MGAAAFVESPSSLTQAHSYNFPIEGGRATSLCIAVIGATGELARGKIFPALFALYYSGFLPEVRLRKYHCSVASFFTG